MKGRAPLWTVDPNDPRAPPLDIWEKMTPEERQRVVDSLPSEFTLPDALPPEGDRHYESQAKARYSLKSFYGQRGRGVYIGSNLAVYYPGERVFAPDLIAVLDVDPHPRDKWVVEAEKKGIDFAMEIHVAGDRRKDLERNVEWFARLGIKEYFIFDRGRLRLHGYRLPTLDARSYQPILPQAGRYESFVLGLDLAIEGEHVRFYAGDTPLLDAWELVERMQSQLGELTGRLQAAEERAEEERRRREEETRRREEETRRFEEEARRRQEAEQKLAQALAELERLKKSP